MERWNPWRALRERSEITLVWTFLRGSRGVWVPHGDGSSTIHLDPRLSRRERRCVLGHELVHAERGIAYTSSTPAALVDHEEHAVWAETARRLVPPAELAELIARGEPLELWEIADHFDIDQRTARIAAACVHHRERRHERQAAW